jgi:hypothetical protein
VEQGTADWEAALAEVYLLHVGLSGLNIMYHVTPRCCGHSNADKVAGTICTQVELAVVVRKTLRPTKLRSRLQQLAMQQQQAGVAHA